MATKKDKKKSSKSKNNDLGFILGLREYDKRNFKGKSLDIIKKAKEYTPQDLTILASTYPDVTSQIIGSLLSTLVYKAAKQPTEYLANRYGYLKEVADIIKKEQAYTQLFEFVKVYNYQRLDKYKYLEFQIMHEINELIEILVPLNQHLVALDDKRPVFINSKFPYTPYFIGKANNMPVEEQWTKKDKEIINQNYARSNIKTYFNKTYGYYTRELMDFIPQNSVNLIHFAHYIKLPRKLSNDIDLSEIILKNRKYVINKNGVVIDCYNAGDIETILLVERNNLVYFKVILRKKGWVVDNKGNLVDDVNGGEYTGIFTTPQSDIEFFYSYLDFIEGYQNNAIDILEFVWECYTDILCGFDWLPKYLASQKVNNTDSILYDNSVSDSQIEDHFEKINNIGVRYTPLSLYKTGVRTSSRSSKEAREKYFVSGHLRRLLYGQKASLEARLNASEYGITLPPSHTFVIPHYSGLEKVRSYYKKVVE